LKESTQIN